MKKILFIVSLLSSLVVVAQPNYVTGYLTVNENRNQRMLIARALNLPVGTTPALQTGQWVGFGGLYADSTGGNRGIHYYNGTGWVKLADTTYTGFGGFNIPIGSGYKVAVDGTNDIKSFLMSNGLTGDSATAGQVGIKLGQAVGAAGSPSAFTSDREIDVDSNRLYFQNANVTITNNKGIGLDDSQFPLIVQNTSAGGVKTAKFIADINEVEIHTNAVSPNAFATLNFYHNNSLKSSFGYDGGTTPHLALDVRNGMDFNYERGTLGGVYQIKWDGTMRLAMDTMGVIIGERSIAAGLSNGAKFALYGRKWQLKDSIALRTSLGSLMVDMYDTTTGYHERMSAADLVTAGGGGGSTPTLQQVLAAEGDTAYLTRASNVIKVPHNSLLAAVFGAGSGFSMYDSGASLKPRIAFGNAATIIYSPNTQEFISVDNNGHYLNGLNAGTSTERIVGIRSDGSDRLGYVTIGSGLSLASGVLDAAVTATSTTTFTNKRWTARVGSTTSSGTPTINTDNVDIYKLTAQAANITSMTTNLSGTPVDGDILEVQITATGAFTLAWGASFIGTTVALPTAISTTTTTIILQYYTTSSYGNNLWHCINFY